MIFWLAGNQSFQPVFMAGIVNFFLYDSSHTHPGGRPNTFDKKLYDYRDEQYT